MTPARIFGRKATGSADRESLRDRENRVVHILVLLVLTVLALGEWQPLVFRQIQAGLDNSWIAVLGEALAGRFRFGTDIVFTVGPLNVVHTKYFQPDTLLYYIIFNFYLIFSFIYLIYVLLLFNKFNFHSICILLVMFLTSGLGEAPVNARDILFLFFPWATGLIILHPPGHEYFYRTVVIGTIATAVVALAKFSLLPLGITIFVVCDVGAILKRRLPLATLSFAVSFFLLFFIVAPSGSDFIKYFTGSWALAAGYTSAMSLEPYFRSLRGGYFDYVLYAIGAAAVLMSIVSIFLRITFDGVRDRAVWFLQFILVMLFIWFSFKNGFVRHDGYHVVTAYFGLAFAIAFYVKSYDGLVRLTPLNGLLVLGVVLVCTLYAQERIPNLWASSAGGGQPSTVGAKSVEGPLESALLRASAGPRELANLAAAISQPVSWYDRLVSERNRALADVAATSPVAELAGTVDMIGLAQSSLIGAKLDYRPRPTVQEYTTFSSKLAELNRKYFESQNAPDHLLFRVMKIDRHMGNATEGAVWPTLMARYRPVGIRNGFLLFERRREEIVGLLGPTDSTQTTFDQPFKIDPRCDAVFLKIRIDQSMAGKLINLLFKGPTLQIVYDLPGGQENRYRLVPGQSEAGFVAWPIVDNAAQMNSLFTGQTRRFEPKAASVRIEASFGDRIFFRHPISVTQQCIDTEKLKQR